MNASELLAALTDLQAAAESWAKVREMAMAKGFPATLTAEMIGDCLPDITWICDMIAGQAAHGERVQVATPEPVPTAPKPPGRRGPRRDAVQRSERIVDLARTRPDAPWIASELGVGVSTVYSVLAAARKDGRLQADGFRNGHDG